MDSMQTKFTEQEAPEKNTDGAFVQVGRDGQPVFPFTAENKPDEQPSMPVAEKASKK